MSDISGLTELNPADSAKIPACVRILVTYQKAAVDRKTAEVPPHVLTLTPKYQRLGDE